jgi:hypothetical protein
MTRYSKFAKLITPLVAFVVIAALAFGVVSTASAQNPGGGRGPRGLLGGMFQIVLDEVSAATNLDATAIREQIAQGKTLSEIVNENGGNAETVIATVKTRITDELNAAVAAGNSTQERADAVIARLDTVLDTVFNTPLPEGIQGRRDNRIDRRVGRAGLTFLVEETALQSGLTLAEVGTELQAGKTLAQIATENGADVNTIVSAAAAMVTEEINRAVQLGRLTQEQADAQIATLTDELTAQMNEVNPVRGFMGEGRGGRGGWGGRGNGNGNQPAPTATPGA